MSRLAAPVRAIGETANFTLRFVNQTTSAPCAVQMESYSFMGQPLKILRIVRD